MRDALATKYQAADLALTIVWTPMLDPDSAERAERSSHIFAASPNVKQFWDPNHLSGASFREHVFPQAVSQMTDSLPDDHFFKPYVTDRNPDQPEWDIYMFFDIGAQWGASPPVPARFLRQTARLSKGDDTLVSLMWRDDYAAPPIEGQIVDQLEIMASEQLDGSLGAYRDSPMESPLKSIEFLAFPGCPNAPTLRRRLDEALKRLDMNVSIQTIDLEQLEADDPRLRYGAPTILINGRDLMGAKPLKTGALCCRTYDLGELPDIEQLCAKLSDCISDRRIEKE